MIRLCFDIVSASLSSHTLRSCPRTQISLETYNVLDSQSWGRKSWSSKIYVVLTLFVWGIVSASVGCTSPKPVTSYGANTYPGKYSSVNGLGVFEQLCKNEGAFCVSVNRLSARLDRYDALILYGDTYKPLGQDARDWVEQWLAEKTGRTLIYFGKDFDAYSYYQDQTESQIDPSEVLRARVARAVSQSQLDEVRTSTITKDAFCRWFTLRTEHQGWKNIDQFEGEWSEDLAGEETVWPVRSYFEPPKRAAWKSKEPKQNTKKKNKVAPTVPKTGQEETTEEDEPVVVVSDWEADEILDKDVWNKEWQLAPESEVLLAAKDGVPLVVRLTSDRFAGSQILTVANGAPFLNGTLVKPMFRKVAHRLVDTMQPAKRVAFLAYEEFGLLVSRLDSDDPEAVGLSVLTTWPMNLIVAHCAMLGILVCLALFPIPGRPQRIAQRSVTDFGQHVESLGDMLRRAGDLPFSLKALSEYFRRVRKESVPAWLRNAMVNMTGQRDTVPTQPVVQTPQPIEPARPLQNSGAPTIAQASPQAPESTPPNT